VQRSFGNTERRVGGATRLIHAVSEGEHVGVLHDAGDQRGSDEQVARTGDLLGHFGLLG